VIVIRLAPAADPVLIAIKRATKAAIFMVMPGIRWLVRRSLPPCSRRDAFGLCDTL
jgi:hypothetical protein